MNVDLPSATAFSPPSAIFEPAGRRGAASGPRPRPQPQDRSSSVDYSSSLTDLSKAASICLEVEARLRELRIDSYSEGIQISERSLGDFRAFQRENSSLRRPAIFVTGTGNIRAVWKSGEEQISLQFFGGREAQFVIFAARRNSASINRLSGNIGLESAMSFARSAGIEHLFTA